ncbi:MAG: DUF2062 domain-containing protein [Alphaproteobacteria bacterium]|nr:DUF2062 domain-containing protein [Alphaproteobacteria bacterium]
MREFFWPRMGFRRAAKYFGYRVVRLPGSTYAIAGGFAWGAAVSFTPFIGMHFILAGLAAWLTRCSILASAIGTAVGNPWTFPFIWTLVYNVGVFLLRLDAAAAPANETLTLLFQQIWQLIGDSILVVVGLKEGLDAAGGTGALETVVLTVLWPMFVGSLPIALIVWILFYLPLRRLVASYQHRRRRLHERRRAEITGASAGDMPKS